MIITLRDEKKEFPAGSTAADIAKSISDGLFRASLSAKVNGEIKGMYDPINSDAAVELLTFASEEGKKAYRHTTSHILAQAVKRLYPSVKIAIGPSIDNGFYYDFEFETPFTKDGLPEVESEMKKIIKENHPVVKSEISRDEALKLFGAQGEVYKTELIEELPKDAVITLYTQGEFSDLCAGPHAPSTGYIKAFKLTSVTGAYWRGSEKNKMLTRIYGTSFDKKAALDEYLAAVEEARASDHNKLGRELGYFMTDENIGQGLPLLMPKGATLFRTLTRFVEDEELFANQNPLPCQEQAIQNIWALGTLQGRYVCYRRRRKG